MGRRWDHLEAVERLIREIQPLADTTDMSRWLAAAPGVVEYRGLEDRRLLSALSGPLAAVLDNQRRYLEATRSRADLERWLNGMGEGVIIVDADRRSRFVNAAATARLDIHEGDACGELAGPEARPGGTGDLQRYEFVRSGVTWEASAAPLANPDETSSRIIVVRDLTERQRRAQELMRAERLESLALLAGGIAHDFNNILTAILGNLELAKLRAASDESLQRMLSAAGAACGRAKRLTGQLLTFSRGGAPVTRPLDVGRLLAETVGFATSDSAVRHELRIASDLWPALADEGQIAQVVSNLVINAVQAMPRSAAGDTSVSRSPTRESAYPRSISSACSIPGSPRSLAAAAWASRWCTRSCPGTRAVSRWTRRRAAAPSS